MRKLIFIFLSFILIWNSWTSGLLAQSFLSDQVELPVLKEQVSDAIDDIELGETATKVAPESESPGFSEFLYNIEQVPVEVAVLESIQQRSGFNQEDLNKILELLERGEYNLALANLEDLPDQIEEGIEEQKDFEINEFRLYLTIQGNYRLGNYSEVETLSESYFENYINGNHYYWVYYYYATALFSQKKPLRQVYLVTEEFFHNLPNKERSNLRKYLIEDALNNKQVLSAINFLENEDGKLLQGYERWIDEIIENINDVEDIEQIVERYENEPIYYQLQLRKVQLMIRDGDLQKAEEFYYNLFLTAVAGPNQYNSLSKIYDTISLAYETKPYKIGVILPFSHKVFKRYAMEVQDGLELGLSKYKINGKPIQLIFKDSAQKDSNPEFVKKSPKQQSQEKQKLVKAHVRDLVENHGVIAILGPLARNTSLAAGEMADEYKIPIISFSLTENIGKDLPCLFRFQRSQFQEARVLANYAVDYLNASRFVLFYHTSSKSFEVMQTFAEVVKEKGGEIVGIARIAEDKVDFNDTFKSFTGGFQIRSEEEEEELKLMRDRPKPIIDFDAIFLPVDIRTLKIVTDFAYLFDAGNSWFLSGSEINVRENQLLNNTSRLRFVDTYPVSHFRTHLQPFFEAHWRNFNYRSNYYSPTNYTIFGYESIEILGKLLSLPQNQNREALRDAVQNLNSLEVLTGIVNADKNGELDKQLKILKIQKSETVAVF
ncbi:penicillin-binding protein activator [bacterium]|nr:penicillin-binding protein activator [bacterium]